MGLPSPEEARFKVSALGDDDPSDRVLVPSHASKVVGLCRLVAPLGDGDPSDTLDSCMPRLRRVDEHGELPNVWEAALLGVATLSFPPVEPLALLPPDGQLWPLRAIDSSPRGALDVWLRVPAVPRGVADTMLLD